MLTCKSPRKVMRAAYLLARESLPAYSSEFSRHDFTLPQLFACLVVKESLRRSYREAEALLADCDGWLRDVGLHKAPDHNTLWRAAKFLLAKCRVDRLLDAVARWAALARCLGLSLAPRAVDATYFEPRRGMPAATTSGGCARRASGGRTAASHAGTPAGPAAGRSRRCRSSRSAWRPAAIWCCRCGPAPAAGPTTRTSSRSCSAPGAASRTAPSRSWPTRGTTRSPPTAWLARHDMGLRSLIPVGAGRPAKDPRQPPGGRWRRHMKRVLATKRSRKRSGYTQRWQAETVNSMMKRNLGSALRGHTAWSRKRDMYLKAITHDLMVL